MSSLAKKLEFTSAKSSAQYERLQKLLSFRQNTTESPKPATCWDDDDFIDIVLDADFNKGGKVRAIK